MADAAATSDAVVDDAWSAAEGTRKAARWITSAFGAIPSLAIIGAIVRAPGEGGFDGSKLTWGVLLAALGATVGILAFARVFSPLPLEDTHLADFNMTRVSGSPYATFADLVTRIEEDRATLADSDFELIEAERLAKAAEAEALAAQATQKQLEADLTAAPTDEALKRQVATAKAATARALADQHQAAARSATAAKSAAAAVTQFERLGDLRKQAYQLKASDEVRERYTWARVLTVVAVALIALGLVNVGLAPNPKADPASPPSLVKLELNEAGRDAIGCEAPILYALRVGGTDATPKVITFATDECEPKTVDFKVSDKPSFGTATPVKAIPSS